MGRGQNRSPLGLQGYAHTYLEFFFSLDTCGYKLYLKKKKKTVADTKISGSVWKVPNSQRTVKIVLKDLKRFTLVQLDFFSSLNP